MTNPRPLQITVVGDCMVGKTTLIQTYVMKEFIPAYDSCSMDSNYYHMLTVDGQNYSVTLCDTPGQTDYDRLRPLYYPETDCFLLCYSISNRSSLKNVVAKWYPEIRHYSTTVPIVLVGTKSDLRISKSGELSTTDDGMKLRDKIYANAFVECSAKEQLNLNDVFFEAIRAIEHKQPKKVKPCEIL